MANTGVSLAVPITFYAGGTLATGDGKDGLTMPFDAIIWHVKASVGINGTSSGQTDFVIERTPNGGSAANLWTVAADIGRIAHDSDELYLEWDWENDGWAGYASGQTYPPTGCRLKKEDLLELNIDAIPGGSDSADLTVTLWVVPVAAA